MKPKKAIVERIATIMPIATRNTPFTISLTKPQRMPNTQRAVRMIRVHIASPMYCAICLKSAVAVIAVSFVKFHDVVNPAVKEIAECGLVGSLVFRPMSVLLHDVGSENVGKVKCVFLSHRSFSFRVLKKVGIRECKVFRKKYYPQGWRFFPKTGGLTLLSRQIPELPLRPERK